MCSTGDHDMNYPLLKNSLDLREALDWLPQDSGDDFLPDPIWWADLKRFPTSLWRHASTAYCKPTRFRTSRKRCRRRVACCVRRSGYIRLTECSISRCSRDFYHELTLCSAATAGFAIKLLGWKHSGFSVDNPVRILGREAQTNLAEYIPRPPVSLKKIHYEPFKGRVLFHDKRQPQHHSALREKPSGGIPGYFLRRF